MYIHGIDGLRAIAVLGVLLFHFFPNFFRGGYLGVDIFFVISGFLMSQQMQNFKIDNLVDFYLRRIKRLFPALALILILTLIFGYFISFPSDFKNICKQTISGILFFSNFLFWSEAGYFDMQSESKHLLHLWSLSIEEQFYIFFPLLYLISKNHLKKIFGILFLTSLSGFLIIHKFSPEAGFYFLPFRMWELLAGSLIFLGFKNIKINKLVFSTALILLLYLFKKNSSAGFSTGIYNLVAVIATAIIIIHIISNKSIFLENKYLSYLGKISYPLYLVHWPVIVFSKDLYNDVYVKSVYFKLYLLILCLIMAITIYETFELELKKIKFNNYQFLKYISISFICIISTSLFVYLKNGLPLRIPIAEKIQKDIENDQSTIYGESASNCKNKYIKIICNNQTTENVKMCEKNIDQYGFGAETDENYNTIFIGDSHVNQYFYGYQKGSKYFGNALLLGMSSTAPFINTVTLGDNSEHRNYSDIINFLLQNEKIKNVVISGYWSAYHREMIKRENFDKFILENNKTNQSDLFEISLFKTIEKILSKQKNIIIVLDIPIFQDIKNCYPRPFFPQLRDRCSIQKRNALNNEDGYREHFFKLKSIYPKITLIDPFDLFCKKNNCTPHNGNTFFYTDYQHLSKTGSIEFDNFLRQSMIKTIK